MAVAIPKDLSLLNNAKYKSIFYQKDSFSDSSTVAFSIVTIDEDRNEFPTISSSKGHAEIAFIRDVKEMIKTRKMNLRGVDIKITIMLSKSPCFRCRADLETFFEYLRVSTETRITFTLRIANLYCGDIDGGVKNNIMDDLALWFHQMRKEKIVDYFYIQPISVTQELKDYTDRKFIDKDGVDKDGKWKIISEKRKKKDKQIVIIVIDIKKRIDEEPVNTRKLFVNLNEVKDLMKMAEGKRNFYKSQATRAVAVAQVQINAVNEMGRSCEKFFRPIVASEVNQDDEDTQRDDLRQDEGDKYQHGCCATIPRIKDLLDEKKIKPETWSIRSSTIVLAVTHFPCDDCLARITSDLHELKPRLILRVANIPYEEAIVDWLFELYQKGLAVELHAIQVITELGRVYYCKQKAKRKTKRSASQEDLSSREAEERREAREAEERREAREAEEIREALRRAQWEGVKQRRPQLDEEAKENVRSINSKVAERLLTIVLPLMFRIALTEQQHELV